MFYIFELGGKTGEYIEIFASFAKGVIGKWEPLEGMKNK